MNRNDPKWWKTTQIAKQTRNKWQTNKIKIAAILIKMGLKSHNWLVWDATVVHFKLHGLLLWYLVILGLIWHVFNAMKQFYSSWVIYSCVWFFAFVCGSFACAPAFLLCLFVIVIELVCFCVLNIIWMKLGHFDWIFLIKIRLNKIMAYFDMKRRDFVCITQKCNEFLLMLINFFLYSIANRRRIDWKWSVNNKLTVISQN